MKFGSLFAGIGGMDLGLERAGMECVWQVENNPYCLKILKKHWPHVRKFGDIKELTGYELGPVDLVAGGFPCQPASQAGQRKGQADERWLWPDFARVLRVVRPRIALVENVPGLLNVNGGTAFNDVLSDLASLGYDAEWDCIPAIAVGASHLRYRTFIVAHSDDSRCVHGQAQVFPTEAGLYALGEPESSGEDVAHPPSERLPNRYAGQVLGHGTLQRLERCRSRNQRGAWATEPNVGRVADGVPHRVDRITGLGNAVVPQVAEFIGKRIMEVDMTVTHTHLSSAEFKRALEDAAKHWSVASALRNWAASNHSTSGHSSESCPACQVLDILEVA